MPAMVRGGQKATVHSCDAAFDPASDTSLLVGMNQVLTAAAQAGKGIHPQDVELATILYGPLHRDPDRPLGAPTVRYDLIQELAFPSTRSA